MITRIVIGGCRTYNDYTHLKAKVDIILSKLNIQSDVTILSGHCKGVDILAEQYANDKGYKIEIFKAQWNKYGKSAGPIRNELMVQNCDFVIAFWDGKSKGTRNLIQLAQKYNRKTTIVDIKNRS